MMRREVFAAGLGLWLVLLAASGGTMVRGADEKPKTPAAGQNDLLSRMSLTSKGGPVSIQAKQLEFDYRTRTLVYRGGVVVSQADLKVTSDTLRLLLNEEAKEVIREVTAEGHVRIEQGQRVATGEKAIYDQSKRTVVLSQNAVLREGPNEVAGERVVVYLDEQRMVVEGGNQQVRAVLYPQDLEKSGKSPTQEANDH